MPPFGQDRCPDMSSVFEIKHLRAAAYTLSTQCQFLFCVSRPRRLTQISQDRMPVPLGNFISGQIYESTLNSDHWQEELSCVSLVDVSDGREERCGHSYMVCRSHSFYDRSLSTLGRIPPKYSLWWTLFSNITLTRIFACSRLTMPSVR